MARLFLSILLAALAVPTAAHDIGYGDSLRNLQLLDTRVQTIGWRLADGNASFCDQTSPAIGLLIQDLQGYNRPDDARSALAIPTDFAVQAVAEGSPADKAGLQSNQPIVAIDYSDLSGMVRDAKAIYLRLLQVERVLQSSLEANGVVALNVADDESAITVTGVPVCKARFVVRPSDDKAAADAASVYVGGNFAGLSYADDELAAAMAHELAHVVLGHPQWLSANGRKRRDIRETEREADRLMPWLLANAGYDPAAAVRFMRRWGPEHGGGLFRKRTHDGWDERVEFIEAELPLIGKALENGGAADWSARFPRKAVS
ncbi:hypothetical protein [Pontixanthobacter aquaemixtae]|uniref:PDZ domain-containing protein n=1 Tax=Pontixanthobacter aquaemixtae TaxID=1958940 RepID=A0A844ZUC5_9SPHN|nr:hypothetical protein [Pontixanthobacter aquaemixtae]MXO91485.1 hypothetical protein [Pontixanthobacter aquaemixtae]